MLRGVLVVEQDAVPCIMVMERDAVPFPSRSPASRNPIEVLVRMVDMVQVVAAAFQGDERLCFQGGTRGRDILAMKWIFQNIFFNTSKSWSFSLGQSRAIRGGSSLSWRAQRAIWSDSWGWSMGTSRRGSR